MWNLLEQQRESLNVYLDGRNIEFTMKQLPNRPKSVEPRLWCAVYSRPITEKALLPSVVLIKKTAHVKSNKSSMLSVSLEDQTCSREERNASPQWKSTHRLFKAFPSLSVWLLSLLTLSLSLRPATSQRIYKQRHTEWWFVHVSEGTDQVVQKKNPLWATMDDWLKRTKEWQKETWEWHIFFLYVVLTKFAQWHDGTSKQSTSTMAAWSKGQDILL